MKKYKIQRNFIKCRNCGDRWKKAKPPEKNPIHFCKDPIVEQIRKMEGE